jgi:hypothetical protein
LRGHDFASVQAQVEQASQWLKAHAPAPAANQGPSQRVGEPGWCAIHNTAMPLTTKSGRSWYSHWTADGWCKGRRR